MTVTIDETALATWDRLNVVLMATDEAGAAELLRLEASGRNRPTILLRIHSRLNKLRADRERLALMTAAGATVR